MSHEARQAGGRGVRLTFGRGPGGRRALALVTDPKSVPRLKQDISTRFRARLRLGPGSRVFPSLGL